MADRYARKLGLDPRHPWRAPEPFESPERIFEGSPRGAPFVATPVDLPEREQGARALDGHVKSFVVRDRLQQGRQGRVLITPGGSQQPAAPSADSQNPGSRERAGALLQAGDQRLCPIELAQSGDSLGAVGVIAGGRLPQVGRLVEVFRDRKLPLTFHEFPPPQATPPPHPPPPCPAR